MILKGHLDTAYVQSGERAFYRNVLSRDDFWFFTVLYCQKRATALCVFPKLVD